MNKADMPQDCPEVFFRYRSSCDRECIDYRRGEGQEMHIVSVYDPTPPDYWGE